MTSDVSGQAAYDLATELFPICRSLTGAGVRETLRILQRDLPALTIHEVASGTECFDWTVPDEWNIEDAYVEDASGERVIDFRASNLHVVGYSEPVDRVLSLAELQPHLYSLPEMPDAIPYVTSYYARRWGFCLTDAARQKLVDGEYRAVIRSSLQPGSLTYGELIIPGTSSDEVFLSTYVCHPSMGNNELSGPAVAWSLARWVSELPSRKYTYRFIFIPETIGSIVYLSRHLDHLKQNVVGGFNLSCVGDDRAYSYLPSRRGNTISDRIAQHVLDHSVDEYVRYTFLDRGSDERQYCSPGVDLPICTMMRSKFGAYPEYHTSLDDLDLISPSGLGGSIQCYRRAVTCFEHNETLRASLPCEPQMGKRGLYPTLGHSNQKGRDVHLMMDLLAYADGESDLLQVSESIRRPLWETIDAVKVLADNGLLERTT